MSLCYSYHLAPFVQCADGYAFSQEDHGSATKVGK